MTNEARRKSVLRPPVDILEDEHGITLCADLPGVSRDNLHLHIGRDILTIEGETQFEFPDGMEALYEEVHAQRYQRSFTLSAELASESAEAKLKDGVLTLHIPKRAEIRPRKIEVNAD